MGSQREDLTLIYRAVDVMNRVMADPLRGFELGEALDEGEEAVVAVEAETPEESDDHYRIRRHRGELEIVSRLAPSARSEAPDWCITRSVLAGISQDPERCVRDPSTLDRAWRRGPEPHGQAPRADR